MTQTDRLLRELKFTRVYQYRSELTSLQSILENLVTSGNNRGHPLVRSSALPGFENLGRLSADWRRFGTLSRPVATYFANLKLASARCVSHRTNPPAINSDLLPSRERIFARILTRATLVIAMFIPWHDSVSQTGSFSILQIFSVSLYIYIFAFLFSFSLEFFFRDLNYPVRRF